MTERKTKAKTTEPTLTAVEETPSVGKANFGQPDIFKPLGSTTVDGMATISYVAEIGDALILKTVTLICGVQSEALMTLQGMKVVPTPVDGFYKVVKA